MFMLLKAVYSGILQAYHAKGSSWQSRLMLVMVRVLMKKDVRLQNTQDELLEIAREVGPADPVWRATFPLTSLS